MKDPYQVLGVKNTASQDEIRQAYLNLVKKYHPDKYQDSDLKELANEKLKEVNEAYDTLTKRASSSANASSSAGSGYGYSGSGNAYSGPSSAEFARARQLINANNLEGARQVLDSINVRNAEWYYLYGIVYLRQGYYDRAKEYLGRAYRQEPGNPEYANAYSALRNTGNPYSRSSSTKTNAGGCSACDICTGLLCTDCCCECMGGDFIRCI